MMGAGGIILALGLLGLVAAAGGRRRTGGGISSQTRARVSETLATPDSQTGTIPVEAPPRSVDPDRAPAATSTSSTSSAASSTTSTPPADMTFRPDAEGRYPSDPGYVDPDVARGGSLLTITPPDSGGSSGISTSGPRDPAAARSMASAVASAIRSRSSGWRNRLREFQYAAGLANDGIYGGMSYNALRYYGINNPPAAHAAPRASSPDANYVDRIIAPPSGTGT